MNKVLVFLLLILPVFSWSQRPERKVILIGIDGLNVVDLQAARTPTFDRLKMHGSWTLKARSVMPSSSSPNWASMIMGAPPSVHGVWSNAWRNQDYLDSARYHCPAAPEHFPTVFYMLKRAYPQAITAAFHQWMGWKNLPELSCIDKRFNNLLAPEPNIRAASRYFIRHRPDFLFIHLDHCDHAGHTYGHGSWQYLRAVERADRLVGEFIRSLEEKGLLSDTYVIVTSDHGGYLKGHGGPRPEERMIPWFIIGPGIKEGHEIQESVDTYDTARMIAECMRFPTHECWQGKTIREVFTDR